MAQQTDAQTEARSVAERFSELTNQHDLAGLTAMITDDCVFESTFPAPDGVRHEGREAVSAALQEFFESSPKARFDFEETFACGDRAVVRWKYHWVEADGTRGHVRGVDLIRVRDGKLAEMLAYVKG